MSRVLIIVFLLFLVSGCGQDRSAPLPAASHPVRVATLRLAMTEARECRSLPGQVEAKNSVTLSSKLSGTVTEVLVEEGARVAKGQPILRIDDAELRLREQSVRSTAGQAGLERQALAARMAQARATHERMQRLLATHAVSQDDADRARAEYESLASQTRALAAQTAAVGFQGQEVRSLMAYGTVTAPMAGILTRRYADLGTFVSAGQPLAAVDDGGSGFEIAAQADESLLGLVRPGLSVVAAVPTLDAAPFLTTLTAVIAHVDPASRAFRVKAALDSPAASSGMFGKICVPVASGMRLLVPARALRPRGELLTAYIVDSSGVLRLRLVKVGARYQQAALGGQTFILAAAPGAPGAGADGELVEVLAGLHAGEEVVLDAPDTAREGDRAVRG